VARFLTLSKAARLVGIKRGALQKKIQAGELTTFEGMLELNELLRVYPNVEIEDSAMLERVNRFAEDALTKVARANAILPDAQTLLARVSVLSQELAAAKAEVSRYAELVDDLKPRIAALDSAADEQSENGVRTFKAWFLHALEGKSSPGGMPERVLAREAFLRVMAAHVRVVPSGHEYFVEGSDNLLEAGLRAGIALPFGCNDASCGRCVAKILSGQVRSTREPVFRLTAGQVEQGYVLACGCAAVTDVVMEVREAAGSDDIQQQQVMATVRRVETTPAAVVIRARPENGQRLRFLSGQYVQLQFADGSSCDCAVASCSCDEHNLEFHVAGEVNATALRYTRTELSSDQQIIVRGPKGDFILDVQSTRPLVFIAFDSGFGCIKSMVEHAMALDNSESISLYRVSSGDQAPYQDNLCRSWSDALDDFDYTPITGWSPAQGVDPVVERIVARQPHLETSDIYIVAPASIIRPLGIALETRTNAPDQRIFIEPIRYS
jgi:CDP-4-dehydro-6-deoxyglucose reductase